ncbi:MAG: ATP-binding cassette domain-containing protein [Polyangiaceae bacterium]|nr:ATP-binding cassette domain-containing protein [Polyangiaceae bacterium]MCW5792395.1 ATP-binding cassette domain-containing protein [Polyangiaceae bacterium]
MIEAKSLGKRFGYLKALDKVSFQVRRGEVVGFLGPNGAGKSTTMRILTCFIAPTSGSATVHGIDVFEDPLAVREKIGYLPQRAPLYTDMTVWDYLEFTSRIRGIDAASFTNRLKQVVEVCGLAQVLGKDIGTLSHGYRQRVGLGQALIHDPPILILDEPTADLDPNEKAELLKYIKRIGKDRTILLSTHNLHEVEEACARAIIVSKGRVVADGVLDDIRAGQGQVRYTITIDEQQALRGSAPKAAQVLAALKALKEARGVRELPTDERAHRFEVLSSDRVDLRAELFKLAFEQGWLLLELRRDAQSLDMVFRNLTKGDEAKDRGRKPEEEPVDDRESDPGDDESGDDAAAGDDEPDDDDDDDDDESDDDESDDDDDEDSESDDDDDEKERG